MKTRRNLFYNLVESEVSKRQESDLRLENKNTEQDSAIQEAKAELLGKITAIENKTLSNLSDGSKDGSFFTTGSLGSSVDATYSASIGMGNTSKASSGMAIGRENYLLGLTKEKADGNSTSGRSDGLGSCALGIGLYNFSIPYQIKDELGEISETMDRVSKYVTLVGSFNSREPEYLPGCGLIVGVGSSDINRSTGLTVVTESRGGMNCYVSSTFHKPVTFSSTVNFINPPQITSIADGNFSLTRSSISAPDGFSIYTGGNTLRTGSIFSEGNINATSITSQSSLFTKDLLVDYSIRSEELITNKIEASSVEISSSLLLRLTTYGPGEDGEQEEFYDDVTLSPTGLSISSTEGFAVTGSPIHFASGLTSTSITTESLYISQNLTVSGRLSANSLTVTSGLSVTGDIGATSFNGVEIGTNNFNGANITSTAFNDVTLLEGNIEAGSIMADSLTVTNLISSSPDSIIYPIFQKISSGNITEKSDSLGYYQIQIPYTKISEGMMYLMNIISEDLETKQRTFFISFNKVDGKYVGFCAAGHFNGGLSTLDCRQAEEEGYLFNLSFLDSSNNPDNGILSDGILSYRLYQLTI